KSLKLEVRRWVASHLREELNGNKIIQKRHFGEMSSIVLASNRIISGILFYLRRPTFVRVGVPATICADKNVYYIYMHCKLALVCVCAMCIGRLGTPLILQTCSFSKSSW